MKKLGFALALLLAAPALAQTPDEPAAVASNEEFGVTVGVPTGWEAMDEDDRAVFNLRHATDHSHIEVIGNELMTPDVAPVFFSHFHDTLQSSDFMQVGREDKSYGDVSGSETVYRFEHTGTALKVVVFQFVRDTTAWLAVGYIHEDNFDARAADFRTLVGGLTFAE